MATYDLAKGGQGGHMRSDQAIFKVPFEVDFALQGYSSADVLQLVNVPAETLVHRVKYKVETVEGATLTFDIGDGSDVDGYIDGANGNSAGSGVNSLALTEATPNTVTGYSNGKYYSAADTIDLLLNNDAAAAKISGVVIMEDLSS